MAAISVLISSLSASFSAILQDVPQNQCKITNFQAHGQIFSALFPLFERVDLVLAVLYVSHRRRIQVVYSYV